MVDQGFFSSEKRRMAGEKENKPFFSVKVEPVQIANNINSYQNQTPSIRYPGDDYKESVRESYTPKKELSAQDYAIDRFTKNEPGDFTERKDRFQRETINYGTDSDGTPTATDFFGRNIDYSTDTIKRYIATDAKEKYQAETQKRLDSAVDSMRALDQQASDFNYYKSNLKFNEKGEPDQFNKFVKTAPEMRDLQKQLGPNENVDKYGIVRSSEEAKKIREKNRLNEAKEETNPSVLQRVGNFLGDTFNAITGTQPAQSSTLDSVASSIDTNSAPPKSPLISGLGAYRAQEALSAASSFRDGSPSLGITSDSIKQSTPTGKSSQFSGGFGRSKAGTNTSSTGGGGISKSTSRGQGGGTTSRSKGGSFGGSRKSNTGSKSSARGARGSTGSRGRGGTGTGSSRSGGTTGRKASSASKGRTGRSRSQCDIRTKIDVSPLINSNLVKDNLAEVAYFVQEIKK